MKCRKARGIRTSYSTARVSGSLIGQRPIGIPRTANNAPTASNRDDEAWLAWARAAVQRDPTKAAMIKAVATAQEDPVKSAIEGLSLMLAEFASSLTTKPDTPRVVRPAPLGVPPFSRNGGDGHRAVS
jgi:hypothetical protein